MLEMDTRARASSHGAFWGNMTFEQAQTTLQGHPPGTYLFRTSNSCPGSLVVSFVNNADTVTQSLMHVLPHRSTFQCENPDHATTALGDGICVDGHVFVSLDAFIQAYRFLRFPLAHSQLPAYGSVVPASMSMSVPQQLPPSASASLSSSGLGPSCPAGAVAEQQQRETGTETETTGQKVDNQNQNHVCGVCYEKSWDAAFVCGHVLCQQCAMQVVQRRARCPFCRLEAVNFIKLFVT